MSKEHLNSIQKIIDELGELGFTDITDQVKPHYGEDYLYLCTLERPEPEREKGPIYCETLDELLTVLAEVNPLSLPKQVWFCEKCQIVSINWYRKSAGVTEVMEALGKSHREESPNCPHGAGDLRVVNHSLITSREVLNAESSIPDWAKDRIAKRFFGPDL
jgi:hypothetical protein